MKLIVNGVLTDFLGRILLQRKSERDLTPVSRAPEIDALPAGSLARAFREETGLIVLPVRLTGLYYDGHEPGGRLTFTYRCLMRGGDLQIEPGRLPAGFFDGTPLPAGLSGHHRHQIHQAIHHDGGPPHLERENGGLGLRLSRLLGGAGETSSEGPSWKVGINLVTVDGQGRMLGMRAGTGEHWRLPATIPAPGEAPWESAARLLGEVKSGEKVDPSCLKLIEAAAGHPEITFVFAALPEEQPGLPKTNGSPFDTNTSRFGRHDSGLIEQAMTPGDTPVFIRAAG